MFLKALGKKKKKKNRHTQRQRVEEMMKRVEGETKSDEALKSQRAIQCAKAALMLSSLKSSENDRLSIGIENHHQVFGIRRLLPIFEIFARQRVFLFFFAEYVIFFFFFFDLLGDRDSEERGCRSEGSIGQNASDE